MTKKNKNINSPSDLASSSKAIDEKRLLSAVRAGDNDVVARLLADSKWTQDLIDQALPAASSTGCVEVVRTLLAHGANVHTKDDRALQNAAANGHAQVVAALLHAGADVHAQSERALMMAVSFSHDDETVAVLLKRGANARAKNYRTGVSALGIAAVHGKLNMVDLLIAYGADRSSVDDNTRQWMMAYGCPEILARIDRKAGPQYALESDYAVSTETQYPNSRINLKTIFDFRAREVITLGANGDLTVRSFDQVSKHAIADARQAFRDFHWKAYHEMLDSKLNQGRIAPRQTFYP